MSDVNHKLHREIEAAKALRANLADLIDGDEETAADFIEGETNLNEAIDAAVTRMLDDEAALNGIEVILSRLDTRRNRIKTRIANTKTALLTALEQAGKRRHEHAAVTLSLRPVTPSLVITDETIIPSMYWKAADPKLDKRLLLADIKGGVNVGGAMLSNGGTCLTVSTT